jgi:hypothetical protein
VNFAVFEEAPQSHNSDHVELGGEGRGAKFKVEATNVFYKNQLAKFSPVPIYTYFFTYLFMIGLKANL